MSIHPGLGHTGAVPFDDNHGWYRSYRSLAGCISYKKRLKGWELTSHSIYPVVMKQAVMETLRCSRKIALLTNKPLASALQYQIPANEVLIRSNFGSLPVHVLYNIFEFMVSCVSLRVNCIVSTLLYCFIELGLVCRCLYKTRSRV